MGVIQIRNIPSMFIDAVAGESNVVANAAPCHPEADAEI